MPVVSEAGVSSVVVASVGVVSCFVVLLERAVVLLFGLVVFIEAAVVVDRAGEVGFPVTSSGEEGGALAADATTTDLAGASITATGATAG